MFWLHHPQPVRPRKAVAELTVVQKAVVPMNTAVIVIDSHPAQAKIDDSNAFLMHLSGEKTRDGRNL